MKRVNNKAGRPRLKRRICFSPEIKYFKPQGVGLSNLKIIELSAEELEVLRLKNIKKFSQFKCAKEMKTSSSTIQRLLSEAEKKITLALIEGWAIKIKE